MSYGTKYRTGGTDLFSKGELRALAHELPELVNEPPGTFERFVRVYVVLGEMMWPDGPAQVRKRIVINYLRKQHRRVVEERVRRDADREAMKEYNERRRRYRAEVRARRRSSSGW